MAQPEKNIKVTFNKQPGANGCPTYDCFQVEEEPFSVPESLADGDVFVKMLYLSLDPAMRCCMNDSTGVHYLEPFQLGQVVLGLGGTAQVIASNHSAIKEKSVVAVKWACPWQKYATISGNNCIQVDQMMSLAPGFDSSIVLSCLGLTGLTAYLGVLYHAKQHGNLQGGANQVAVVSGAAGATGSLAGQIFKYFGAAKVIGIAGGEDKCKFLVDYFGFDGAIDYKHNDVLTELTEACPEGVHFYFDNVGGSVSEAVISQMVPKSVVILCGQISQYNKDVPYPPPIDEKIEAILKEKEISRERFLVLNHEFDAENPECCFASGIMKLTELLKNGTIKVHHHVTDGIENAGTAFVDMMNGKNIGKAMVKV